MTHCPSCGGLSGPHLVCSGCGGPVAAKLDCFAALGLERKLVIDPAALERMYHELSRRIHPDRFVQSPPAVRDASLRSTALLTRSYRALRDPVSRAIYWLELNGERLGDDNKRVPAEIAELVFEVQERLAELREARNRSTPESYDLAAQMAARRELLAVALEESNQALVANFRRWDSGDDRGRRQLLDQLKAILARNAYLRTLIRDVDRELEGAKAPQISG